MSKEQEPGPKVTVKLTAKEKQERATECTEKVVALKAMKARNAKAKKRMKEEEKELQEQIDALANASKTGEEEQDRQLELQS